MSVDTARFESYVLEGNETSDGHIIGKLVYDNLGKEVLARHNKTFRGIRDIEDKFGYEENEPISFSNVPRVLHYNQILRELTDGKIRVLSPEEIVKYWNSILERDTTEYANSDSVVLYNKAGQCDDLRRSILDIVRGVAGHKATRTPLIVSGLGVEKADNRYGFTFIETEYMRLSKASFLKELGKLNYIPFEIAMEKKLLKFEPSPVYHDGWYVKKIKDEDGIPIEDEADIVLRNFTTKICKVVYERQTDNIFFSDYSSGSTIDTIDDKINPPDRVKEKLRGMLFPSDSDPGIIKIEIPSYNPHYQSIGRLNYQKGLSPFDIDMHRKLLRITPENYPKRFYTHTLGNRQTYEFSDLEDSGGIPDELDKIDSSIQLIQEKK